MAEVNLFRNVNYVFSVLKLPPPPHQSVGGTAIIKQGRSGYPEVFSTLFLVSCSALYLCLLLPDSIFIYPVTIRSYFINRQYAFTAVR